MSFSSFINTKKLKGFKFPLWGFVSFIVLFFLFPQKNIAQNTKIYLPFKQKGLWGVMDLNKNILISPKYSHISFFEDGYAVASIDGGNQRGIITPEDKVVVPFSNWRELSIIKSNDKKFFRFSINNKKVKNDSNTDHKIANETNNIENNPQYFVGLMNERGDTLLPQTFKTIKELQRNEIISPLHHAISYQDNNNRWGILGMSNFEGFYAFIDFIIPQQSFITRNNRLDDNLNNQLTDNFLFASKNFRDAYFVSAHKIPIKNAQTTGHYIEIPTDNNYTQKKDFLIAQQITKNTDKRYKGIYDIHKKELAVDLLYTKIVENQNVFYLYEEQNISAIFYKGNLNTFPENLGKIKNISYDRKIRRYFAHSDKGFTIFLDENFNTISAFDIAFDEISDFKGNIAIFKKKQKYGIINRSGVLLAPANYTNISLQGNKIRLYKQQNTEFCIIMMIDEDGNKIDEFETTLKLINLKGTAQEDEWQFVRSVQQNSDILAEKDKEEKNIIALDRNNLVPQSIPVPNNMILEAPKKDFNIGTLSFVYDSIKTTHKNLPIWHTKLTKPKEKRACYVQISRDSNYVYLQTDYEVQITRSEKEIRIKGELINTHTGERVIEHRFNSYKKMLEQTLFSFEKNELALVDNTFFLEKTGKTIRFAEYIAPKTKKIEKIPITRIYHTDHPDIKLYVVKGITDETGKLMENSGIYGLVDKNGNFITKPLYNNMLRFDANNLIKVENFETKVINKKFERHGQTFQGCIDTTGKEIISPIYSHIDYIISKNNQDKDLKKEKYLKITKYANLLALCDSTGIIRTPFIYQKINLPIGNFCLVKKNNLWGVINTQGKEIIPTKYNEILEYHNGIFAVKQKGLWGFFDNTGKEVLPTKYEKVGKFEGNYTFIMEKGKYGIVDKLGNVLIKPSFQNITAPIKNYAFAQKQYKWGVINVTNEQWIIRPTYKNIHKTEIDAKNKLFKISHKNGTFLLNEQGKKITKNYKHISEFQNGVAIVQKGENEYTLIDINGKELLKNNMQHIAPFQNGLAKFKKNNLFGFLDTLGNPIIKPLYDFIDNFCEGYTQVKRRNKLYYINTTGDSLASLPQDIENLFDPLIIKIKKENEIKRLNFIEQEIKRKLFFLGNIVNVKILKKTKKEQPTYFGILLKEFLGIYDIKGKEIIPVECENIEMITDDLFGILQGGKFGYWHKKNGWFLPLQE